MGGEEYGSSTKESGGVTGNTEGLSSGRNRWAGGKVGSKEGLRTMSGDDNARLRYVPQ